MATVIQYFGLKPDQDGKYDAFVFIVAFTSAFLLPLKDIREIALWRNFVAGTYSDADLEREFGPVVRRSRSRWAASAAEA